MHDVCCCHGQKPGWKKEVDNDVPARILDGGDSDKLLKRIKSSVKGISFYLSTERSRRRKW